MVLMMVVVVVVSIQQWFCPFALWLCCKSSLFSISQKIPLAVAIGG
jgi:hypothetical protein